MSERKIAKSSKSPGEPHKFFEILSLRNFIFYNIFSKATATPRKS